ncbi:MAG: hypothetical protein ABI687_09315, partial [Flavitalea sp.]
MKFFSKGFVSLLFFSLLIFSSCSKKPGISQHPVIDAAAQIKWNTPSDSSYISKTGKIEVTATVSGNQDNYSFLTAYVMNADSKDTLKSGAVSASGAINIEWFNTLAPGLYRITIIAVNSEDRNQVLTTNSIHLYICVPPPVVITELIKDEKSITVHWEKSTISNFAGYEVLVSRTDTSKDLPPYPPGEVIATISDINTTSFKDDDIYFYYKYDYVVRLITTDECGNNSEKKGIEAGIFMDLPAAVNTGDAIFDVPRKKIYALEYGTDASSIHVIDPDLLVVNVKSTIQGKVAFIGMNEDGSALNIVKNTEGASYQLFSLNLSSYELAQHEAFTLPVAGQSIEGVFGKKILYSNFTVSLPKKSQLSVFDITSTNNTVLKEMEIKEVASIRNNSAFVATATNDSFFVYTINAGSPVFSTDGYSPNLAYGYAHAVFASSDKIAIGGNLYDEFYNVLASLPGNRFYTGLSPDGSLASTSANELYNVSTSDIQLVKKYGDGFGTFALSTGPAELWREA